MRLHLTVEFLEGGGTKVLYAGEDVLAAQKAQADSVARAEALRVERFFNPMAASIRYPAAEKKQIADRKLLAKNQAVSQANANANAAAVKREQAQKLHAEADILEGKPAAEKSAKPAAEKSAKAKAA